MLSRPTKLLLLSSMVWFFAEGMFAPFLSVFTQKIGGDILEIASVWVAYLLVSGVLFIVVGHISDKKINKSYLMIAGYILNAIFTFGYIFVTNYWQLLGVEIGLGVAEALATPTFDAIYSKYTKEDSKDGLLWGLYGGTGKISTGVAILLGGLIVAYVSYQTLFLVMGILQTIATLILIPIIRNEINKSRLGEGILHRG